MTNHSPPSEVRESTGSSSLAQTPLLVAAVGFGLAVLGGTKGTVVVVVIGLAALGWSFKDRQQGREGSRDPRLLAVVVLFGLLGALGIPGFSLGPSTALLDRLPGLLWILLAVVAFFFSRMGRWFRITVAAAVLLLTAVIGVLHIQATEGVGLDVLFLHEQAADAIAAGENPYTDAVSVPNGSPTAEPGDVIEGYVYPPATAIAYSLGEWALDDPRYTSLAAWLALLAMIGASALRTNSNRRLYLMLILASLPGWPLVLRAAWTEPLSLALIAAAFFIWRAPVKSGLALGLGLASKQYFAVAAPVLLLHRDSSRRSRAVVALAVVTVVLGVGIAWDPAAFWSATVEFHATTPPRLDSANLVGILGLWDITWDPPTYLTIGIGLVVAIAAGSRSKSRQSFVLALAAALGASFFVSSQAFSNYWFLIMGLMVLGLVDAVDDPAAEPRPV